MKAYSLDLRERVAAACAEPGAKIYEVAARFAVSRSFVNKLLRRQRTSGSLAGWRRSGSGHGCAWPGAVAGVFGGPARCHARRTAHAAGRRGGPALSRTATWRATEGLGWGRKKSVHAAERDTARVVSLRRLFLEALPQEDVTRFVFVDETSTNLTYCRRYGRAWAGRRLDQAVPLHSGPNVTLIAALTPTASGHC